MVSRFGDEDSRSLILQGLESSKDEELRIIFRVLKILEILEILSIDSCPTSTYSRFQKKQKAATRYCCQSDVCAAFRTLW